MWQIDERKKTVHVGFFKRQNRPWRAKLHAVISSKADRTKVSITWLICILDDSLVFIRKHTRQWLQSMRLGHYLEQHYLVIFRTATQMGGVKEHHNPPLGHSAGGSVCANIIHSNWQVLLHWGLDEYRGWQLTLFSKWAVHKNHTLFHETEENNNPLGQGCLSIIYVTEIRLLNPY